MEALIIEHPGAVATLIGFLVVALIGTAAWAFRDLWSRVAKASEKYVTQEQLDRAIASVIESLSRDFKQLSKDVKDASDRLAAGDNCFDDHEKALRVVLLKVYDLCRVWEKKFQDPMNCEDLTRLVRDIRAS